MLIHEFTIKRHLRHIRTYTTYLHTYTCLCYSNLSKRQPWLHCTVSLLSCPSGRFPFSVCRSMVRPSVVLACISDDCVSRLQSEKRFSMSLAFVSWSFYVPAKLRVYLTCGSASTILRAATLRQKLQSKFDVSHSHSVVTSGLPGLAEILERQALGRTSRESYLSRLYDSTDCLQRLSQGGSTHNCQNRFILERR